MHSQRKSSDGSHNHTSSASVLQCGYASVKEDSFISFIWSKRWLVLRKHTLTIHKSEYSEPMFNIYLDRVIGVERNDIKPYSFELRTYEKDFFIACKSDEEVYSWIDEIYNLSPLKTTSEPTNFQHKVHVGFNLDSGRFTVRFYLSFFSEM
ncbi:Protein kinase, partial [Coelomomyces lativittatus]